MPIAILNRAVFLTLLESRALMSGSADDPTNMAGLISHYREVLGTHKAEISKYSVYNEWYEVTGKEVPREHVRYPVICAQLKELVGLKIPLVLKQSVFEL